MSFARRFAVGMAGWLILAVSPLAHGQIVINEVMADNNSAVRNGEFYPKSYVELYNTATTNVSLNGWFLTDSTNLANRTKYAFPATTVIPAREFLVVWCNGTNHVPGLSSGFSLKTGSDDVGLYRGPTNALVLVDHVDFGFQISDMTISRVPDGTGAWKLAGPTPGYENGDAVPLGNPMLLRFNEWLANSPLTADWFEIYNYSTNPAVDMGGMVIYDLAGNVDPDRKIIPPLSFINSNGFQRFWADKKSDGDATECNFKLSESYDELHLLMSPSGSQVDFVYMLAQELDRSEGLLPDGNTSSPAQKFPAGKYTPGESNFQLITNVVFNEVLAHTDPPFVDALELYNPTTNAVRLDYYYLSNNKDNPKKYQFPTNSVVPPLGYFVVYANAFDPDGSGNSPSFRFNSAHGDDMVLCSATNRGGPLTGFRVTRSFVATENSVSLGRFVKSDGKTDFVPMSSLSFGTSVKATDPAVYTNIFVTGTGAANPYPANGPIVISEIMYHPRDINEGTNVLDNSLDEYIELSNYAATNADLYIASEPTNCWKIKGGIDFEFPTSITIPSSGCVLVVNFDPAAATNATQLALFKTKFNVPANFTRIYGPYKGKLANNSMRVELIKSDFVQKPPHPDAGYVPQILVEKVTYEDQYPWATNKVDGEGYALHRRLDRYANDEINWFAAEPTPGRFDTAPSMTAQPQNVTVSAGGTATFSAAAQGTAPVEYKWLFNGTNVLAGQTQTNLVINGVAPQNLGQYSLVASNPLGVVTSSVATLVLSAAPVITQQPESQSAFQGGGVVFEIAATGGTPLNYQWQFNTQDLAGESNTSLFLFPVVTNHAGSYRVVITNSFGSVTSAVATLTVAGPPSFTLPVQQPDGGVRLAFDTVPGFNYMVEGSSNLTNWTDLQVFYNTGTSVTYTYYGTNGHQFFRSRLVP